MYICIYVYVYVYIYIYPPAPACQGPPGCEAYVCNHCFQVPPVLQSPVDSQVFQSFPVLQSAIASLPVWYLLLTVCRSAIWCLVTVYWTQGQGTNPHLGGFPQPGSPQGIPEKSSNFKPVSKTLKNQKKCPQGNQKTPKCDKNPPPGLQITE